MLTASVAPPLISPALAGSPLVRATKIVATVGPRLLLDAAAGFFLPPLPQPPGGALQGLDTAKKGSATGSGLTYRAMRTTALRELQRDDFASSAQRLGTSVGGSHTAWTQRGP